MDRFINVSEMYEYTKAHNMKLLSSFNAPFWNEYESNYEKYDSLFKRLYKSFRFFDQEECNEETVEEITERFIEEVNHHLLLNKKKYEELYRVYTIQDQDYDFKGNVDIERVIDGEIKDDIDYVSGQRSDSTSETLGSQTNTVESEVAAYDSSDYQPKDKDTETLGQRTNSTSITKGSETDTTDRTRTNDTTITTKGKMGDAPISSLINSHIKLWDSYEFYSYIFSDIATELLLV